jgi:hypothetical protein
MFRTVNRVAVAAVVLFTSAAIQPMHAASASTAPGTFVVNTTATGGDGTCDATECTFSEALAAAQAVFGGGTVAFDVPGPLPISLPGLVAISDHVTIDGTTQPGYAGDPVVEIGDLDFDPSVGDVLELHGLSIRSLTVWSGFVVAEDNYVGLSADGRTPRGNTSDGIFYFDSSPDGGDFRRNVISGNGGLALTTLASGSFVLEDNIIGLDATGRFPVPNGEGGLRIWETSAELRRNVIASNSGYGVWFQVAIDYVAEGNIVTGNAGDGIIVESLGDQHTREIVGNTITRNGGNGIVLDEGSPDPVIARNRYWDNGGLAVDVGDDGVTELGVPVIDAVIATGSHTEVTFHLDAHASRPYEVEAFALPHCDPSGFGEGKKYLGRVEVVTDDTGHVVATMVVPAIERRMLVTASAGGRDEAYELSACHGFSHSSVTSSP